MKFRDVEPSHEIPSGAGIETELGSIALAYVEADADEDELAEERLREVLLSIDSLGDYLRIIGKVPLLEKEEEVELAKRMEVGQFASMALDQRERLARGEQLGDDETFLDIPIREGEPLEETNALLGSLARDGALATERFILSNLRLVVNIAKRYDRDSHDLTLSDLIDEGNLGLIRAVRGFDYTRGFKFSTYATNWVKQSIVRGIDNQGYQIRLPVNTRNVVRKLRKLQARFAVEYGRTPTAQELTDGIDDEITPERVEELLLRDSPLASLDAPLAIDPSLNLGDIVISVDSDPSEELVKRSILEDLQKAIKAAGLNERSERILYECYGLYDGQPKTKVEIAKREGLSGEYVRQVINKALTRIRSNPEAMAYLEGYGIFREE